MKNVTDTRIARPEDLDVVDEGGVVSKSSMDPRSYDRAKEIKRPRDREINRFMERINPILPLLEDLINGKSVITVYIPKKNMTEITDTRFLHGLDSIPNGVIPGLPDKAAIIYFVEPTADDKYIYIASDTDKVTIRLLIL